MSSVKMPPPPKGPLVNKYRLGGVAAVVTTYALNFDFSFAGLG